MGQPERQEAPAWLKAFYVFGVIVSLWCFLFGLGLMGDAFKVLGGKTAGDMFGSIQNPLAGLMVGILATVLVQSSSTSTSIVVGLVGSGIMDVVTAIPIIMGANIGTSITNTLVSMGHIHNKDEYQRAFAGATVHDMFNFLTVLILLPLEVIVSAMNGGEGGLLYLISDALTSGLHGTEAGTFKSPVKVVVSPATKAIISVDKDKIKALSMGAPTLSTCLGSAEKPKMVAKVSYHICNNQTTLDSAMADWNAKVIDGSLIKGGAFEGTADGVAGTVSLVLSLVVLCLALFCIVTCLKKLVLGSKGASAESGIFSKILHMNGYAAIFVGILLTISVQSSSIITSAFTPLVGLGSLPLANMLAFSLGANIGTTCTGLLAAMVAGTVPALQIALCHLLFNILGIFIWYPAPPMRNLVLNAAKGMGYLTVCFTWWPFAYVGIAFFLTPLLLLGVSALIDVGGVTGGFGWFLFILIVAAAIGFVAWYKLKGGRELIMSKLEDKYNEASERIAAAGGDKSEKKALKMEPAANARDVEIEIGASSPTEPATPV